MADVDDLFANFPVISYQGQTCIDITQSIKMASNLVSNAQILTPYTMNQSLRSDQFAWQVYNDPYLEWLIFLSNQQTDGFDWYMTPSQFAVYMDNKYGNLILAQQTISYWVNNWYLYPGTALTVSAFADLDPSLVKYYEPEYGAGYEVVGYSRKQVDWSISTNHLVQYCFANTVTFPTFTNNEVVTITYNSLANTSTGQVCYQNNVVGSLQLNVQHVQGTYNYGNTINVAAFSIVGAQSNAKLTISNNNQMTINIYDTISALEDIYYSPMTQYDVENAQNEARKYIFYLPNNYVSQALTELSAAFQ